MPLLPYGFGQKVQVAMGGVSGINPLSLPGLELYLNSTLGLSGSHDSAVSTWPDQSGHSPTRDATQATAALQPKLQTTSNLSPNGKQLVRWDGLNAPNGDSMDSAVFNLSASDLGWSYYAWGVWRLPTRSQFPNFTAVFFERSTFRNPGIYWQSPNNNGKYAIEGNTTLLEGLAAAAFTGVISWHLEPNSDANNFNAYIYANGVLQLSGDINAVGGWVGGYRLGSYSGAGSGNGAMNCDLGAFLVASRYHSAGTRLAVTAYLDAFFG